MSSEALIYTWCSPVDLAAEERVINVMERHTLLAVSPSVDVDVMILLRSCHEPAALPGFMCGGQHGHPGPLG